MAELFPGRSCRVDLRDRRLCLRGLRDSALHGPRRHCGRVRMAEYGYDAQIWALWSVTAAVIFAVVGYPIAAAIM